MNNKNKIYISFFLLSVVFLIFGIYINTNQTLWVRKDMGSISLPAHKEISNDKLWDIIQEWRESNGYNKYIVSNFTCNIAEHRLIEIKNDFSHTGINAHNWCPSCTTWNIGENLSEGFYTEQQTMNAWINSPSHLSILKRNYTHSCLRCDNNYCVHISSYF